MITDQLGECPSCGGTGLYCGFAEPKGTAVICNGCNGTGASKLGTKPYTGRKQKPGVTRVLTDGGLWMCRTDNQPTVSIQEFYAKIKEAAQ